MKIDIILRIFCCISLVNFVLGNGVVETTHGRVSGTRLKTIYDEKNYYAFMGIPFAAPPVNDLRFQVPQKLEPWDGVLSATKLKPACVQYNTVIYKGQTFGQYGVEDCLYLDIYTPAIDDNKRAVLVFLHSERLQNSYNKTKDYAPDFFIEEDIVVVTISHRLSVFGFLSLENEKLPGNAGLKDIVAGLEWITDNIINFGGDPEKITLLGSQGGAAAVDLLIRSKAKRLFRAAILQGETILRTSYLQENARQRFFRLGELLETTTKNDEKLLKQLSEMPTEKILEQELRASPDDYYKETQRSVLTFGPIVEKGPDGLVTGYPENSFENINIPIMIGFNSREGLAASIQYLSEPHWLRMLEKDFHFLMPVRINFNFEPDHESYYDAIDDIKNLYFKNGKISTNSGSDYVTYIGDVKTYAIDKMAQIYSNISLSPVYYYHFNYYSNLNDVKDSLLKMVSVADGTWGATAGDELCYIFKCPSLKNIYLKHRRLKTTEMIIQKKIIKLWANFINYGNPTPDKDNPLEDLKWPAYNLESKQYLHIDEDFKVKNELLKKRFKFWDDFFKKWSKRAELGLLSHKKIKKDEL